MTKPNEDNTPRINVVGRHIEITQPIRDYIEEKIGKIEKLAPQILEVSVRLDVEKKIHHIVHVIMKFSHFKIVVHAETTDMYATIDKAFEKLRAKIKKWKDKIQSHHAKGVSFVDMQVNILENTQSSSEEIEEEITDANNDSLPDPFEMPKVMKTKTRPLKSLTFDEAVMKMQLSHDNFLVFRSEEDQGLKVLYRRTDGNFGMMAPE